MLLPAVAVTAGLCLYTYLGYPAILTLVRRRGRARRSRPLRSTVPRISIVLPVYNEAAVIAGTLDQILAIDYPADRRQILVVSDASTDGTDEIVARFADRGVELLRMPRRQGKTAAENAARRHLSGDIIVNTDASVRIEAGAIRRLVAAFGDDSVGVASSCDVGVASLAQQANSGEGAYIGYEMWLRDLETAVGGIVGASGSLYAIRAELHMGLVPDGLSRDFAAALTARQHGLRAVSVAEAKCFVPRSASLRQEYRRKVRTITRGIATLGHKRALLNPLRYGVFAWMLFSHKVCRWLVPWALLALLAALGASLALLSLIAAVGVLTGVAWVWPDGKPMPRLLALPGYVVVGNVAVLHAWLRVVAGRPAPVWEPTRRASVPSS